MSNGPERNRMRDFWQLDLPLVIALVLCTTFTIIEATRAAEGVWRAWIYMFEWPMIGAFCIWMWVRFKREPGGGFARQWRERATRYAEEPKDDDDPELAAWRAYRRTLDRDSDGPSMDGLDGRGLG